MALFARHLWGYAFAIVFLAATMLAYLALAGVVGWEAVTDRSGAEWAGVRRLIVGGIALVSLFAAARSGAVGFALAVAWHATAPARPLGAWVLSIVAALGSVALVGWLVGHDYVHRQLREQNACLSDGKSCASLVNDLEIYTREERRRFALRGCASGDDSVCTQLAIVLDERDAAGSPEVQALDARCRLGRAETCERLGKHLAHIGDRTGGSRYFRRTCDLDVRRCDSAAEAATGAGLPDVALELLDQGCDRDDPGTCRALLRQAQRFGDP